ncbi:DoxX family protein [Pseudarthrobacter sulfonivorans]|uniref:DoxX family protein n=1 Tax=Pseudarthrobacter sulfonivorans TaxID=121292 RepID=UPI00285F52F7|nr:DoxX family protein [Pseudarthrobacter sulfonivorans]MDR6417618.1 putative oxidoreductase [Pseudarthrobacter sulfonivorans]
MTSQAFTPATQSTIARTVLRFALGVVFFAHGWQKIFEYTIPGTQAAFAQMGVPAAQLVAPAIGFLELFGGAAIILGVLVRPVAALLALDMLGALFLVHAPAGLFADKGGYELVLVLAAGAAALALAGAGRFSIDALAFGRSQNRILGGLA